MKIVYILYGTVQSLSVIGKQHSRYTDPLPIDGDESASERHRL